MFYYPDHCRHNKDGSLECRLHPLASIVWSHYHPYCTECYSIKTKIWVSNKFKNSLESIDFKCADKLVKNDFPMFRTRPYRKFIPIRK